MRSLMSRNTPLTLVGLAGLVASGPSSAARTTASGRPSGGGTRAPAAARRPSPPSRAPGGPWPCPPDGQPRGSRTACSETPSGSANIARQLPVSHSRDARASHCHSPVSVEGSGDLYRGLEPAQPGRPSGGARPSARRATALIAARGGEEHLERQCQRRSAPPLRTVPWWRSAGTQDPRGEREQSETCAPDTGPRGRPDQQREGYDVNSADKYSRVDDPIQPRIARCRRAPAKISASSKTKPQGRGRGGQGSPPLGDEDQAAGGS